MKVLATADWHIGSFRGPEKDGVNLRSLDTMKCLKSIVARCKTEEPDLTLVSGDIFHQAEIWQGRSHKEVLQAREIIMDLANYSNNVIVMRGTPNHDSEEAFDELKAHFEFVKNVYIVTTPSVIHTSFADVAVIPGFDKGVYRAKFPGLSKEEENAVFSEELGKIVVGLRAETDSEERPAILMAHTTVPGANAESGQTAFLSQFEPVITQEMLKAANYDLVALGHIHRPQVVFGTENVYYSGAVNQMNFNDEGQERGFWIHTFEDSYDYAGSASETNGYPMPWPVDSKFITTPYREFKTITLDDSEIAKIVNGDIDAAISDQCGDGLIKDKIVRVRYSCTDEHNRAFNKTILEKKLYELKAFFVADIELTEMQYANRKELKKQEDPEQNLLTFMDEKQIPEEIQQRILEKARPIIASALAHATISEYHGSFIPVSIEVKNYRNYSEQAFDFSDISCCTINGQNGAGKSSLFLDAILDCLYEEPREGDLTGWIRNDEKAHSGSISFVFKLGDKTFRVVRTRAKSGKATLNLSEQVDGEWQDRSCEKMKDTQEKIVNILGMDSMTIKACALIMQDQYGLFLEASKEDRMGILSNLLGLGVYGEMELAARDKAREVQREITTAKTTVGTYESSIAAYGDPEAELKEKKEKESELKKSVSEQRKVRDEKAAELQIIQSTMKRADTLRSSITALYARKADIESSIKDETKSIEVLTEQLEQKPETKEKIAHYNFLMSSIQELSKTEELYDEHEQRFLNVMADINGYKTQIEAARQNIEDYKKKLILDITSDPDEIRRKADEYETKKRKLVSFEDLKQKTVQLKNDRKNIQKDIDRENELYDTRINQVNSKQQIIERKTKLLKSSNCIDVENANCEFLKDAKLAVEELKLIPEERNQIQNDHEKVISEKEKQLSGLAKQIEVLGFSETAYETVKSDCEELAVWADRLIQLHTVETKIAVLNEKINQEQSNIASLTERLAQANLEAHSLNEKLNQESDAASRCQKYREEAEAIKGCVDEMNRYPILEESRSNHTETRTLFQKMLSETAASLEVQTKELDEIGKFKVPEDLSSEIDRINTELDIAETGLMNTQKMIGGLMEKISQTEAMRKQITDLQDSILKNGETVSDYELLKNAFSQDGIPHQIIRTLLPRITASANSILGQMTGGKMGIVFRTEKVLKSNTAKEVVTLDVLIEEYGKSVLPYLSKSGGEKVKASLSVILALAEVKASTAGIQLGMLFIDEPPFLDGDGIQAYCDALDTIQKRYPELKIMAITHDNSMKARFPQSVDVIKTDKGSQIIYE